MKNRSFSSLSRKERFEAYIAMTIMIAAVVACVLAVIVIIREKIQRPTNESQKVPNSAEVPSKAGLIESTNETSSSTEPITFPPN